MDIARACQTIRQCNEGFSTGDATERAEGVVDAVRFVKSYLESVKADGKPIRDLEISESLLLTPEGMRWVMPFVLDAESLAASEKRSPHGSSQS
jgi:hypothetical protein